MMENFTIELGVSPSGLQVQEAEQTILLVTQDFYADKAGGIGPPDETAIPDANGGPAIPVLRAFGWSFQFLSGDEGFSVAAAGLQGGHGAASRPSVYSHAQFEHFPTALVDPDDPTSDFLPVNQFCDYLDLFAEQEKLREHALQIVREFLQPGETAEVPANVLTTKRDDPDEEKARTLLLHAADRSTGDYKPLHVLFRGSGRSTASSINLGVLEAVRLLCIRACKDVARLPLPYVDHPELVPYLAARGADNARVPHLSWWAQHIPGLPPVMVAPRSLHTPWKMGALVMTIAYENAMLWEHGQLHGNNSAVSNKLAIGAIDDVLARSPVGKRFSNEKDLFMGRQILQSHAVLQSDDAAQYFPYPVRCMLYLSDIHLWLNKITSFSKLPRHLQQVPSLPYYVVPMLLWAVTDALDGSSPKRVRNGCERMKWPGNSLMIVHYPGVVVVASPSDTCFRYVMQVLAGGGAGRGPDRGAGRATTVCFRRGWW